MDRSDHVARLRRLDPRTGLAALVDLLHHDGYRVVGPVVRDGVIAYDDVGGGDLPDGWRCEQGPGRWRLVSDADAGRFSWTPGADSWKRFAFPPHGEVVRIRRADGSFVVEHPAAPERPLAVVGARDCELRALDVLDRVFLDPEHPDPRYAARRAGTFVVAVTCGVPSATCWCTSAGGGPHPEERFDIRLTEVLDAPHRLVAESGSDRGDTLLERLPSAAGTPDDLVAVDAIVERAVAAMARRVDVAALPDRLAGADDHPHWDDVAARCLSCGNCTSVCPTCTCSSFTDRTDLGEPDVTVREQTWVSCFQLDHSNLGGRPVRATTAARYRQWLTHKLATWPEQYGVAGCVGCGRCTTWCPAGIDLPAEALALVGGSP